MRGFPKYLNCKQDFYNLLADYPAETRAYLQSLMGDRFSWFTTKILAEGDAGKTSDTLRVIEQDLPDGGKERLQQELREDPNTRFFLIGWTVDEAAKMLEAQS
jgi:hypothetical protein